MHKTRKLRYASDEAIFRFAAYYRHLQGPSASDFRIMFIDTEYDSQNSKMHDKHFFDAQNIAEFRFNFRSRVAMLVCNEKYEELMRRFYEREKRRAKALEEVLSMDVGTKPCYQ